MPLPDLVDEGLPKSEEAHGVDYAMTARAVLHARIVMDAGKEAAAASKSAALAARLMAIATFLLLAATVALVLVEVMRPVAERVRGG
jgi:hypothetical protein